MKKQAFNPYLPSWEYIPDGEPRVFGDRVYIFGSHDQQDGLDYCPLDYVGWSAPVDDPSDWRYEGVIYRKEQDPRYQPGNCMYAPDITVGPDGRYYLYYTLDFEKTMAVAVSDNPAGPFAYYGRVSDPSGHVLGDDPEDILQFDPGVLVDDDGRVWLYSGFGFFGTPEQRKQRFGAHKIDGCYCMELEQDMLTLKADPVCVMPQKLHAAGTEFEAHPFFEASSIRKINGLYYLVYSSSLSHELCYAVSAYPNRDFRAGGTIVSNGDIGLEDWTADHCANYTGNNHGGMVKILDQWYIFYHRHTNYQAFSRQACAEKITIGPDGSIRQVEMTSCGLNGGDLLGQGSYSAAIACQIYAQGGAVSMYRASFQKELHPTFTQDEADNEENETQYITNLRQGSVAGYKYFDLSATSGIRIRVRGSSGAVNIYDRVDGSLLSRVEFAASEAYREWTAPFTGGKSHSGLFFVFDTLGRVDFLDFTLEPK